jgi:hypothetical protein
MMMCVIGVLLKIAKMIPLADERCFTLTCETNIIIIKIVDLLQRQRRFTA